MIDILADSPDDEALIAEAVGSDARVVSGSLPFANGDVECPILGCRERRSQPPGTQPPDPPHSRC